MFRKFISFLLLILLMLGINHLLNSLIQNDPLKVAQSIVDCTVEIYAQYDNELCAGTGVVCGDHNYVLTCSHIFLVPNFEAGDCNSIFVRRNYWDAQGVWHSALVRAHIFKINSDLDCCLLSLDSPIAGGVVRFYSGSSLTPIGTEIFHVGNFGGFQRPSSLVEGIISNNHRTNHRYQCDLSVMSGSSGGGIFLKSTGEYIGMIESMAPENHSVSDADSLQDIRQWADSQGINGKIFR